MSNCVKCGKTLSSDEIGLHKKLINRGADRYMCLHCLADYFRVEESLLLERIEYFRSTGCLLFARRTDPHE